MKLEISATKGDEVYVSGAQKKKRHKNNDLQDK